MKKIICLIIFTSTLMFVLATPVNASKGLIEPKSNFYFMQNWGESLKLLFTFSKEKKLNYLLELTDRRVKEVKNNPTLDPERINKITNRYTNHFKEIEKTTSQLKQEKKTEVIEKIKTISLTQQEDLVTVYEKISETAREKILNAEENSANTVISIIEKVEGSKTANQFQEQLQQIRQVQIQTPTQKIETAPMEGGTPAAEPSQTQEKQLLPIQLEKSGQELHQLGPSMETELNDKQPMQPVSPAPIQPKN